MKKALELLDQYKTSLWFNNHENVPHVIKEIDETIAELEASFILPISDLEKLIVCAFDKGRLAKNVGGGLSSIDVDTYEAHNLLVRCLCECYIKIKE